MAIVRKKVGSGFSEREVVVVSLGPDGWEDPESIAALREANEEQKQKWDILPVLNAIEVQARSILTNANLPTDGMYDRGSSGVWRRITHEEFWAEGERRKSRACSISTARAIEMRNM